MRGPHRAQAVCWHQASSAQRASSALPREKRGELLRVGSGVRPPASQWGDGGLFTHRSRPRGAIRMPPHQLSQRGLGLEALRPGPCPCFVGSGWAGAAPRRLSGELQPVGRVPGVGARRHRCGAGGGSQSEGTTLDATLPGRGLRLSGVQALGRGPLGGGALPPHPLQVLPALPHHNGELTVSGQTCQVPCPYSSATRPWAGG